MGILVDVVGLGMEALVSGVVLGMAPLVDEVGEVTHFLGVEIGDVGMVVGVGMNVAYMIATTIWIVADVAVDGEDLMVEETLLIGVGIEVIVVALKGFAHGVIAVVVVEAAAAVAATAAVGVGAGLEAVVVATAVVLDVAGATAVVLAAVAVEAMTDLGGQMKETMLRRMLKLQNLKPVDQGCLLCPQVNMVLHFQGWREHRWLRVLCLRLCIQRLQKCQL